ncbi:MAG: YoaK family protein [Janthinobacterium lividum]
MKSLPPPSVLAAFGLVLGIVVLAGFVDAYSFVRFQEMFVSFMSGNTTSLGVATAKQNTAHGQMLALVISLFVGGVVLGTLLHNWLGSRWSAPVLLGLVAALLLLVHERPALGVGGLTLAMGVLNASVHKVGEVQVSLTYFTGALVKFGTGLANLLGGQHESWDWLWQFGLWLSFLGGSLAGALMLLHHAQLALPLAAGFSAALALLAAVARGLR